MRFRKATVLLSLSVICFVLAAQSVKAEDIVFNDLADTVTVTNSSGGAPTTRLGPLSCATGTDNCSATLSAPAGFSAVGAILYRLGEGSVTGNVSDTFTALITPAVIFGPFVVTASSANLTFTSDPPTAAGELNGLGPCVVQFLFPNGCNAREDGTQQLVGTITWTSLTPGGGTMTDRIYAVSGVEPEPASLILFGSGLVIAGGFLRRRHRLAVTPSV